MVLMIAMLKIQTFMTEKASKLAQKHFPTETMSVKSDSSWPAKSNPPMKRWNTKKRKKCPVWKKTVSRRNRPLSIMSLELFPPYRIRLVSSK